MYPLFSCYMSDYNTERVYYLKIFEAMEDKFYISSMQKTLSARGSSNSETVCFNLNRYAGKADLVECYCTIKTKNSEGKSDLAIPEITSDDKKLNVLWTLSSGATAAVGILLVQIQFEKIFDDSTRNIIWQSNIMEFEIPDSLNTADEITDQAPTLFQQWEEKVSTLYSDAAAKVQSMQALQNQVQTDVDTAKTYADVAAVSAQSAQTSAQTAQQKVDLFSGYTKTEIDNGFAGALIGEKSGQSITLDDIQPNTNFLSLLVTGKTTENGAGDRSPDNPHALFGTTKITVGTGTTAHDCCLPQAIYSLPSGVADSYDAVSGEGIQRITKALFDGSSDEQWYLKDVYSDSTYESFALVTADGVNSPKNNFVSDKLPYAGYWEAKEGIYIGSGGTYGAVFIKIKKSRMTGWSDNLTAAQKNALFKTWLATNPITIMYELAKPIALQTNPQTIEGAVLVSADSGTLSAKYICSSNTILKKIKDAIVSLGGTWPQ